ncbi:MAG: type II toxin-antitoxin system VapC family toxin [Anaerolineae bacterium]
MIAVLDVSAAVEILLQKEKSRKFQTQCQQAAWVIAPDLFVSEIANVFWKYHRAGVLDREMCLQLADDGLDLIDDFVEVQDLWKEALAEGIKNERAVYDMFYLVLARRNDAMLITNDSSLASLCRKLKIAVVDK